MLPEERTVSFSEATAISEEAPLRCADADVQQRMIAAIDAARDAGDTLGGVFEVIATGVPVGLGSYVQWDRKLDGRLGQALMCIHAIKAVGIGIGPEAAVRPGSRVHDEILPAARRTAIAGTAHEQCWWARGRRDKRRRRPRDRLHEADLHADEAASFRGPGDDD